MGRGDSAQVCAYEAAVIAALDSRLLDAETAAADAADTAGTRGAGAPAAPADASLVAHARACAICQEAIEVWRYLQTEAREIERDLDEAPLRHPGLIWWRRRILDQQRAAHRLLRPIAAFQIAAGIAALIALALLLRTGWNAPAAAAAAGANRPGFGIIGLTVLLALAPFVPLAWTAIAALRHRPGRH